MIKMFSKNRSSRQKDKNRNASSSSALESSRMSGSVNRSQEQLMYTENTSPARNPSGNYAMGYDNGSMDRPPRGRAMSDGSPAEFPVSSPLDFPLEHLQSFNVTYGLNPSQRTFIDSRSIPRHTPLKSLSPTHSRTMSSTRTNGQGNVRACSTSSLGTSMRDRSLDRMERENVFLGESSLDKHFEQIQYNMQMDNHLNRNIRYNTTGRDRSLDRDYPHMGARSLERDHHSANRSRSTDRGIDFNYPSATLPSIPLLSHSSNMQSDQSSHEFRNSLVFEMQVQISDLHKENSKLQKDLDQTREKLSASMNSIKTFWSPELKKERAVRKEEAARCNLMTEQLKVIQAELKKQKDLLKEHEGICQLRGGQKGDFSNNGSFVSQELTNLKQERDLQSREMLILKKTIEELEIRIDSQRQTLDARDESIKKLLEMLHSKGINVTKLEDDKKEIDTLQKLLREEEQKRKILEQDISDKDARISSLEKEVKQNQVYKLGGDSETPADHKLYAVLEARIQALKEELSKKDTQLVGLQMKVDSAEHQQAERDAYMAVLKEQTISKEKQIAMLQADIEGLQERLKVKDGTIERKNKETSASQLEKRKQELEIMELKDQLEIKASRVSNLQRKIEGLEDMIREKEDQLSQARVRLTSTFTESSSDNTVSNLEKSLAEKEKQIERLKDSREQMEKEHHEELEVYIKKSHDMKLNIESLQKELTVKQTEICELREQQAELRSAKFEQDGKIRRLESELQEKLTDYQRITLELEEFKEKVAVYEKEKSELLKKKEESQPANVNKQECKQLQGEIDKLQEMLKEAEAERTEKDNEIKELQEVVKEYKQKMGTLKRNQQTEKKKNAQLLEEARKREDSMTDDASHLSIVIKKSTDRVEELEEALRQSVIITAEREMAMADLQTQLEDSTMAMKDMSMEIEHLQQISQEYEHKLETLLKEMAEKEAILKELTFERQKHLEEVYEMKQEALQAAISEKDSTLAVLEMTSTKNQKNMEEIDKLIQDKHRLQAQLREVTAKHMKLLSDQKHEESLLQEEMNPMPFICTSSSPVEKTKPATSPSTYQSIESPQENKLTLSTEEISTVTITESHDDVS